MNYTLRVVEVRKETEEALTICFKQPALKKVQYKAGQYLSLVVWIDGRRYIRPYSISSTPVVDPLIEITIKRVKGGIVSNYVCDNAKEGDLFEVFEPMGDFVINDSDLYGYDTFILWGAGSGITPLFSIAKYLLWKNIGSKVVLVYGNKSHETTILIDKINVLQAQYPDSFSVFHYHSQLVPGNWSHTLRSGRIDPAAVLNEVDHDPIRTLNLICGPSSLKNSVKAFLSKANFPKENTLTEDFEIVRDEREFVGIETQTLKLRQRNSTVDLEVKKGKSVLDAALEAEMMVDYSCQIGNCKLCRATVSKGKVKHIGLANTSIELDENECLLCCTYPLSNDVEIMF